MNRCIALFNLEQPADVDMTVADMPISHLVSFRQTKQRDIPNSAVDFSTSSVVSQTLYLGIGIPAFSNKPKLRYSWMDKFLC